MITPNARMSRDAAEQHDEEPTPEDWEIIRDVAQALELDAPDADMAPHAFHIPIDPWTRIADALEALAETAIELNELIEQLVNRDRQCNP